MAPERIVHRFNPFDLQRGSHQLGHEWVQEVIDYGESQLKKVIVAICTAEDKNNEGHLQEFLWKELVWL